MITEDLFCTGAPIGMACSDNVLRYNSHGKKYDVPRRRVFSLDELQRGDHITFHRISGSYWHHSIVEEIDTERGEIHVIEYTNTPSGFLRDNCGYPKSPGIAEVVRQTYLFGECTVYLMLHESKFDRDDVVRRAQSRLGERKYGPVTNNCEHLAMSCVTGKSSSDQVNKAGEMVNEEVGRQAVSTAARTAAKRVPKSASNIGRAFSRSGMTPSAAQTEGAITIGTKVGGKVAGAVLVTVLESYSVKQDVSNVLEDLKTGKMDENEANKTIGKRIVTGTTGVVGSTAGMCIGQALIPIPVLGAAVGGTLGTLAGKFLGNVTGNAMFDDSDNRLFVNVAKLLF